MITLWTLAWVFTQLSLMAFGGGNAVLPEMQHQIVVTQQWMTAQQFSYMFAIAQAAPGPNMMIVPLVGWHVAGPMGVLVTSIAKFGPSSLLTLYALKYWDRFKHHPRRILIERALKPITVSLILISTWIIAQPATHNPILISVMVISACLALFKSIHPIWIMLFGAALAGILLSYDFIGSFKHELSLR